MKYFNTRYLLHKQIYTHVIQQIEYMILDGNKLEMIY